MVLRLYLDILKSKKEKADLGKKKENDKKKTNQSKTKKGKAK